MHLEPVRPLSSAARGWRRRRAALAAVVLAVASSGHAWADDYLQPIGGPGGGRFEAHCPVHQFLAGFELRAADDVDAIRPLCVVAYGPRNVSPPAAENNWHGGSGGGYTSVVCPSHLPVVTGMFVAWEGKDTYIVNNIHLFCGVVDATQAAGAAPSAGFDAPQYQGSGFMHGFSGEGKETQHCPAGQLAVGLHGRSGIWLDAMGLICAAAPAASVKTTVTSLGKVGKPSKPRPSQHICDSARDARARNSPAAPNLEAQCLAAGGPPKTTVTSLGRVGTQPPKPGPPQHICDRAREARARNSPAAPNLEAQCLAAGGLPTNKPPAPVVVPTPPPPPESEDSKKRAARDAAITDLIGIVASSIDQSRRGAADYVDRESSERRREPYPRNGQSTTEVERGASTQELSQPENSIRVEVRYPIAYGYKDAKGALDPGPDSCAAFYLSAFPHSGHRIDWGTSIATQNAMRSSNGMYVCEYLISNLPLNQRIGVRVAMSDQRAAGSEPWLGGSQAQPPAGQRRTIVDGDAQVVVLTDSRPRASLSYEMAYSGSR